MFRECIILFFNYFNDKNIIAVTSDKSDILYNVLKWKKPS